MNPNDTLINLNKSHLIDAGTPEIQSSEKLLQQVKMLVTYAILKEKKVEFTDHSDCRV